MPIISGFHLPPYLGGVRRLPTSTGPRRQVRLARVPRVTNFHHTCFYILLGPSAGASFSSSAYCICMFSIFICQRKFGTLQKTLSWISAFYADMWHIRAYISF